jgi:hypothetical protein
VSMVFTKPYAREQEAGLPKAGGLGRLKNILAASTRQDWEAHGPRLWVDSGRAFIPWPRQEEDGRLVVSRWQYDLCRVISAGEYLGTYPVRTYLRRAGIVVI